MWLQANLCVIPILILDYQNPSSYVVNIYDNEKYFQKNNN